MQLFSHLFAHFVILLHKNNKSILSFQFLCLLLYRKHRVIGHTSRIILMDTPITLDDSILINLTKSKRSYL